MSELINKQNRQNNIRLDLLVTTSAIALITCVASVEAVAANRPTLWIEGGWQFDTISGSNDIVVPPLDELTTKGYSSVPAASNFYGQGSGGFPSFTDMEKALGRSGGAEGSLSFQPEGSDWVFNVAGRYGRTHTHKRLDERKDIYGRTAYVGTTALIGLQKSNPHYTNYIVQAADNREAHVILDFQVGKDVGLGLFDDRTQSVFSLGARYAQMNMISKGHSYAAPGVRFYGYGRINSSGKYQYNVFPYHQKSQTILQRSSSFHGVGPSLSWNNTTALLGDPADDHLALDWGANAAILFGRQRATVSYSTMARSYQRGAAPVSSQHKTVNRTQSHRVTVPNLGGFAALSYHFPNAKLSAGYRADFFFGAMDGGLDTRDIKAIGYHGPYATIAIGLGG